jgi:hypothetical protein
LNVIMTKQVLQKRPPSVAHFLCTLFCAFFLAAPFLAAATYYVAPNGNDSNNGSSSSPFRTIQEAADTVDPGDTVIIRNGTYTGDSNAIVEAGRSGSSNQWITFKAENEWGAILDGRNNATRHGIILEPGLGYVRFEGLQIQGTEGGGFSASENTHDIVYYRNLLHDIGRNCTDTSGGQVGFRDKTTSSRFVYEGNVLHTIGRFHPSEGCNNTDGNHVNHDHGMYLRGSNITIINNVFYNMRSGWAIQSAESADNWVISNNTFAFPNPNRAGQIILWEDNDNIVVANNIFYEPRDAAIRLTPCSGKSNTVIRNNISTAEIIWDSDEEEPTCNNVTLSNNATFTDPGLVNPQQGNFQLSPSSVAINDADASVSPGTDHNGAPRPQGGGFDIGAFEFGNEGPDDDTMAPQVAIGAPQAGEIVSGQVTILAEASDNTAVLGVQFQINGDDLGPEDTTNTFSTAWDTTTVENGLYVITALARDAAGNIGTTAVTVRVENQQEEPAEPMVTFSAQPSTIQQGESSNLVWSSENVTTCSALGDWNGGRDLSGSQAVSPSENATYVLSCTGPGGGVSRTATVTVIPNEEPEPDPPTLTINTNPSTIQEGQATMVSWSSQNTTGCTASNDWGGDKPTSGQQAMQPSSDATYTLTCSGPGGNITRSASVDVIPNPQPEPDPPTLTILSSPSSIEEGQGTMISWFSQNTTGCAASNDWGGDKPTSGQQAMQPSSDATYTLTCSGPGGNVTRSANVSVTPNDEPQQPSLSFEASDTRIRQGQYVRLEWDSEGVTSCRAYGSWRGSQPLSGRIWLRPRRDSRYTLWCSGPGGNVSRTVRIDVRR